MREAERRAGKLAGHITAMHFAEPLSRPATCICCASIASPAITTA